MVQNPPYHAEIHSSYVELNSSISTCIFASTRPLDRPMDAPPSLASRPITGRISPSRQRTRPRRTAQPSYTHRSHFTIQCFSVLCQTRQGRRVRVWLCPFYKPSGCRGQAYVLVVCTCFPSPGKCSNARIRIRCHTSRFFRAREDPANAPIVLIFGGGPGSSGMFMPFNGAGYVRQMKHRHVNPPLLSSSPCRLVKGDDGNGTAVPSEFPWVQNVNLLAIDHVRL